MDEQQMTAAELADGIRQLDAWIQGPSRPTVTVAVTFAGGSDARGEVRLVQPVRERLNDGQTGGYLVGPQGLPSGIMETAYALAQGQPAQLRYVLFSCPPPGAQSCAVLPLLAARMAIEMIQARIGRDPRAVLSLADAVKVLVLVPDGLGGTTTESHEISMRDYQPLLPQPIAA